MVTRFAGLILIATGAMSGIGCVLIPIPRSIEEEGLRAVVGRDQLKFLQHGVTRYREVLLRLGEPDEIHTIDRRTACYAIDAVRTDIHWSIILPDARFQSCRQGSREFLLLRLDENNLVTASKIAKVHYTATLTQAGLVVTGKHSIREAVEDWVQELRTGKPLDAPVGPGRDRGRR